jgi:hypothetical protein
MANSLDHYQHELELLKELEFQMDKFGAKKKKKKTNFVPNWQFIVQELKLGSISIQQSMNKNSCNESTFCALDPSFTSTINAISFSLSNLT